MTVSSLTGSPANGSIWCIMVKRRVRPGKRRFTVTLDADTYGRLKALVDSHDPPLTLNYGVQYAVKLLMERAEDPQAAFNFADPTRRKGEK